MICTISSHIQGVLLETKTIGVYRWSNIKDKLGIQSTLRYVTFDGHLIGRDLFRSSDIQSASFEFRCRSKYLVIDVTGDGNFESLKSKENLFKQFDRIRKQQFKLDTIFSFKQVTAETIVTFTNTIQVINPYDFFNQTHIVVTIFCKYQCIRQFINSYLDEA